MSDGAIIRKAVQILSEGDAVVAPTETVYGLFCDATSDSAVRKVYEIKGRPISNPLIVHVGSMNMAIRYAVLTKQDIEMINLFWDKLVPVTFVVPLPKNSRISKLVTAGSDTVAIRMPTHRVTNKIIKLFGRPLAAPSANTSTMLSPTSYKMVMDDIGNRVRLVIDGEDCWFGLESTIVDITIPGKYRILRHGAASKELIDRTMKAVPNREPIEEDGYNIRTPMTPGMMKKHYAPSIPLRMNAAFPRKGEAFIAFGKTSIEHDINLSEDSNLFEAACKLYRYIKMFDNKEKYEGIAVMPIPEEGVGIGINDRLRRASWSNCPRPRVLLVILDGFGISEHAAGNATAHAEYIQNLMKTHPCALLEASGRHVGLPDDQFGNSEVGHMTIGTGRINKQKLSLINDSIASGEFDKNPVLLEFFSDIIQKNGACHVMGLFSSGGVHSHIDHFFHYLQLLRNNKIPIRAHLFLDGRDVRRDAALETLEKAIADNKIRKDEIASIHGRYYAMDRDKKWERTQASFRAIVNGESKHESIDDPVAMIKTFYNSDIYDEEIYDEEIYPFVMENYHGANENDSFWMINFRTDRIKQIISLIQDEKYSCLNMVSIDSDIDSKSKILFPDIRIRNTLGEVMAKRGLNQLRIAETEKYAHVTYFINGGEDVVYENEDRILVPSPRVPDYSKTPGMSSADITEKLDEAIKSAKYDLIIANYASPDMIGHTGDYEAAAQAIVSIDNHVKNIVQNAMSGGYEVIITADHGNIEYMVNDDKSPCKTHTFSKVPFIYISTACNRCIKSNGSLQDIAPTIFDIMGFEKPEEMTGESMLLPVCQRPLD
jgi:2,3-bisphosphoglycerate-independent phosphoglycerate mutase